MLRKMPGFRRARTVEHVPPADNPATANDPGPEAARKADRTYVGTSTVR